VSLISGDDVDRIGETARKIVDKYTGGNEDPFTFEVVREAEGGPPEAALESCLNAILTPSFMGGVKTVWLQDCSVFDQDRGAAGIKSGEPVSIAFGRLADLIESGFPADVNLVVSGKGINKRVRFYKVCSEHVTVKMLDKPDLGSRQWRGQVERIIRAGAQDHGLKVDHATVEYLIEVIGVDTGRIPQELEKLVCFAGSSPTLEDARAVCTGSRDAVFYALNNALGDRDLKAAYRVIEQLVSHSRDEDSAALGLVRRAGAFFKDLLDAKLLMIALGARSPEALKRALEGKDKRLAEHKNSAVAKMHPFRAMNIARQASNYRGSELVEAVGTLNEAGKRMVSTSLPKRFVLEHMVASIVGR
jgi:DNA polymerase III delta subunit